MLNDPFTTGGPVSAVYERNKHCANGFIVRMFRLSPGKAHAYFKEKYAHTGNADDLALALSYLEKMDAE